MMQPLPATPKRPIRSKLLQQWAGVAEDGMIGPATVDALLVKAGLVAPAPHLPPHRRAGLQILKDREGLALRSYRCPAGVWTIGYGHAGGVYAGQVITEARAEDLLCEDLARLEKAVAGFAKVATENQSLPW